MGPQVEDDTTFVLTNFYYFYLAGYKLNTF